ncbi:MAG: response regulator [Bacteroidetes bacterium]|jgi:DNA-binding response OmpR family regulator|nr:response regulator [Bacteroidota bacterium]
MPSKPRILYVEDDASLSYLTKDTLEFEGYEVVHCSDGESALEAFTAESFDLALLDVMLPKMDGFSLAKIIREKDNNIPIIFLTAKGLKDDKIEGLKLGGDDYITKPFSIEELQLKIKVFLKRSQVRENKSEDIYQIGDWVLYAQAYELRNLSDNKTHKLTKREKEILREFFKHPNEVIDRKDILVEFWGEEDYFKSRSLDVFISRIRKLFRADDSIELESIHGIGFRLNC